MPLRWGPSIEIEALTCAGMDGLAGTVDAQVRRAVNLPTVHPLWSSLVTAWQPHANFRGHFLGNLVGSS